MEKLKTGSQVTNVEALIGQTGQVIQTIKPLSVGQVRLKGQIWSAVCKDEGETAEKDSIVKVIAIEGVKLIVMPEEDK